MDSETIQTIHQQLQGICDKLEAHLAAQPQGTPARAPLRYSIDSLRDAMDDLETAAEMTASS